MVHLSPMKNGTTTNTGSGICSHRLNMVKPVKYGSQLGYCTPDGCDSYPSAFYSSYPTKKNHSRMVHSMTQHDQVSICVWAFKQVYIWCLCCSIHLFWDKDHLFVVDAKSFHLQVHLEAKPTQGFGSFNNIAQSLSLSFKLLYYTIRYYTIQSYTYITFTQSNFIIFHLCIFLTAQLQVMPVMASSLEAFSCALYLSRSRPGGRTEPTMARLG